MKIFSNSFQNNINNDQNGSSCFVVSEDNFNNNACIFANDARITNVSKEEPTIFSCKTACEVKNDIAENHVSIYDNTKIAPFSTQEQTQPHTVEESNKLAIQYMKNLQKDFGLTKKQAAGITANLWHESAGMNAGINQGGEIGKPSPNMADDNLNGYGIAQWGGVRKQSLIDYAKKNGIPPSSDAANYGYLKQELKGQYNSVIKAVKQTQSIYAATRTFEETFEHATEPNMETRLAIVDKLMDL